MTPIQAKQAHDEVHGIRTEPIGGHALFTSHIINPLLSNHGPAKVDGEWCRFTCAVVGRQMIRWCPAKFMWQGFMPTDIGKQQIRIRLAPYNDPEKWYIYYGSSNEFCKAGEMDDWGKAAGLNPRPDKISVEDIRLLVDTGDLPPQGFAERMERQRVREEAAQMSAVPRPAPFRRHAAAVSLQHQDEYIPHQQNPTLMRQGQAARQAKTLSNWQPTAAVRQRQQAETHSQAQVFPPSQPPPQPEQSTQGWKTTKDNMTGRNGAERNLERIKHEMPPRGRKPGSKDSKPRQQRAFKVAKNPWSSQSISPQKELRQETRGSGTGTDNTAPQARTPFEGMPDTPDQGVTAWQPRQQQQHQYGEPYDQGAPANWPTIPPNMLAEIQGSADQTVRTEEPHLPAPYPDPFQLDPAVADNTVPTEMPAFPWEMLMGSDQLTAEQPHLEPENPAPALEGPAVRQNPVNRPAAEVDQSFKDFLVNFDAVMARNAAEQTNGDLGPAAGVWDERLGPMPWIW